MIMLGVLVTSSPVLGAPLLPLVHAAVPDMAPADPDVDEPDIPVMPDIAVLDDS
jgi:hypothetical protein